MFHTAAPIQRADATAQEHSGSTPCLDEDFTCAFFNTAFDLVPGKLLMDSEKPEDTAIL